MQPIEIEKIEQLIEPIVKSKGYELVACEFVFEEGSKILRVFIDKEGGVQLEDCTKISYLLGPVLEVEDLISGNYNLEISSPGVERPLRKLADFEKYVGSLVRLRTQYPLENRSHFKGVLKKVQNQILFLEIDGRVFEVPYASVKKARLEANWDEVLRKGKKITF